jgi:hypothetical protein
VYSRLVENPIIDLEATNPSFSEVVLSHILTSKSLSVLTGLTSDHIIPLNSHFDACNVYSWGTIACTKATNACMFHLIRFTSLEMWFFMKDIFNLPPTLINPLNLYQNMSFFLH